MQQLKTRKIERRRKRITWDDAHLSEIAEFAKESFDANSAVLIFAGRSRRMQDRPSIEQRLCDLVLQHDDVVAIADISNHARRFGMRATGEAVSGFISVPVHDSDGAPIGALCVTTLTPRIWGRRDRAMMGFLGDQLDAILRLREEVKAEARNAEQQRLLAREYHHRVRNAYSLASTVVMLTGAESPSVQSLTETTSAQLSALADAHGALEFESNSTDLGALVQATLLPYDFGAGSVTRYGPVVPVSGEQVMPLTLIFNELATNSMKHGALRYSGSVDLRWTCDAGQVVLRWIETSVIMPVPGTPDRDGSFGGTMIELSVSQLGATVERAWGEDGLEVVLRYPLGVADSA